MIGILVLVLISNYISLESRDVIVRDPQSIQESTIEYLPPPPPKFELGNIIKLARGLRKHFTPTMDQITDDIFQARGYMLGSIGMVSTSEGMVLIDAGENKEIASEILKEFKTKVDLPVKYIILTHGHLDHILGLPSLVEDNTDIISSEKAALVMDKDINWLGEYHFWARANQFGNAAEEYALKRLIELPYNPDQDKKIIVPTITFKDQHSFTLGDKTFELYLGPGETEGQIFIWIPEDRALFCGDLYYESFPNLSSPLLEARPVDQWIRSLKMIASLNPEYLIPGHTRPVIGEDKIQQVLKDHIRAIEFVYDKSIAAINAGKTAEEAIAEIKLPKDLAKLPQLQEVYGRIDWSIRGIYQREKGWYDGYGTGLNPLPEIYKAQEFVKLSGGVDKILLRAIELQKKGAHQLVCELCDIVIAANPAEQLARIIKSHSLDYMSLSGNGNMIGFYSSAASLERKAVGD